MTKTNQIQFFDERRVRTVWDDETEDGAGGCHPP